MTTNKTTLWCAVDMYPESAEVIVADSEDALLLAILEHIGRADVEEFFASLKGAEATALTFDDDPRKVLEIWSGPPAPHDDSNGYSLGGDWDIRRVPVATRTWSKGEGE